MRGRPHPAYPLSTLRCVPRDTQRKTRGRADRYSFLVRNFHLLLHTGLARRTEMAWLQQVRDGRHEYWRACAPLVGRNGEVDVVALFIRRQINHQRVCAISHVGIVQGRLWNRASSGCSGAT